MTATRSMLDTAPAPAAYPIDDLAACIDACFDCAQACVACADACLGEPDLAELHRCITLDQHCADICAATGRVLSRSTVTDRELTGALLEACRVACRDCADECERHAEMHEHCRLCAEACRACETACEMLL